MKKAIVFLMLVGLAPSLWAQSPPTSEKNLQFAASQHEIILILLREKKYSQVMPEFQKILDLPWRTEDESLVVKAAWVIGENLSDARQFTVAEQLVNQTLSRVTQAPQQFTLLMLKAQILERSGRLSDALQILRRAQQLNAAAENGKPQ